jgi:DNA-binding NarL/FixJ family response regulator
MGLARVLVIEDDAFARSLVCSVLESANFEVAFADNASSALKQLDDFEPRVCLIDVDLGPGPTGIDIAHAIRTRVPNVGIVFLTSFKDHRLSRAGDLALPKGSRYITKSDMDQIRLLTKEIISAGLMPLADNKSLRSRIPLTSHQIEIMRLVALGNTNQEIAAKLETSEKAIEHVISRTLQKIGVTRDAKLNPRVQLVQAYAELSGRPVPK